MYYTLKNDESGNSAAAGFRVRDVVRFFVVDLIVTISLKLLEGLGFFQSIDGHVLAILGSKVTIFLYVIWLVRDRREAWPETGATTAGRWWAWPLALGLYAAAYPVMVYAGEYNRHLMGLLYEWLGLVYQHQPQVVLILTFEDILSMPVRLLLIFFIVLAGPFLEELTFRGMALDAYRRSRGTAWAVIWTSVLFSLYHFNLSLFLPLSVLGAVFAFARLASRSLWCAVLVHCLHNALTLVILAQEFGVLEQLIIRFTE